MANRYAGYVEQVRRDQGYQTKPGEISLVAHKWRRMVLAQHLFCNTISGEMFSTQKPNKTSRRKEEDGEVLIKIIEFQK